MSSRHLSILHLSGRTFWCGESNRVLVVCRGLHKLGVSVMLGAPGYTDLAKRAIEEGIPVDTSLAYRRGFRPLSLFRDVRRLRQLHKKEKFDVIHLHTPVDTWIAALAFGFTKRGRKPVVIRTRHSDHRSKSDFIHRWLYRCALDHVVLSADALREPMAGLFAKKALTEDRVTVIHSSVNVHRFDPEKVSGDAVRDELNLAGRFCIGLVGRISKEKGHHILLAVLPDILKANPNTVCVFAGEGDQEEILKKSLANSPLTECVRFAGFRTDVDAVVAAMDVMVVPSTRVESSPGVVKEGMAMGNPVVASDVGGTREIIRDGIDGWIVPPGDEQALKQILVKLAQDPELRASVARSSRSRVIEQFSDERLVENNLNLYKKLVPGST